MHLHARTPDDPKEMSAGERFGRNIFVCRDAEDESGRLDVDFGVGITAPTAPVDDVRLVDLPVGEVATTTHVAAYSGLGAAHAAGLALCRAHSQTLTGPRWEVYGRWTEGELPRTAIDYLLRPAAQEVDASSATSSSQ